jgi:hypothetical protein
VNVDHESRHLRMDATHLTDRINIEAILEFLRFARRLALEEFVTQLRLRIERFELDVLFQLRQLALPNLFIRRSLLVRQVLQLIVMPFDSIKRFVHRVT